MKYKYTNGLRCAFNVAVAVVLASSGSLLLNTASVMAFAGGDGTGGDPYQISSCEDLADVNNHKSAAFVLNNDLDCSSSGNDIIIGTSEAPFTGTFDGQNHQITVALLAESNDVALFGGPKKH